MTKSAICPTWAIFSFAIMLCDGTALAGSINESDFGPTATIEDYEGLSLGYRVSTPRVIGNATYTTDDHKLRYASFGDEVGGSGYAIGSNTTLGYIDISLHEPVKRAGLQFGMDWPWTAVASFFDTNNVLLGEVSGSGTDTGMFAGWWETGNDFIRRIRVTDTADPEHIILVDNLYTETVPEPSTLILLTTGALGLLAYAWRRRKVR